MAESTPSVVALGQPLVDAENPWPGPEAFSEADAPYFFGRDRAKNALTRLLVQNRLVILYGRSGLGKTSLLRAGVFPMLREAATLPVYIRLTFQSAGTSGSIPDLRTQVRTAIATAVADPAFDGPCEGPTLDVGQTLWEWFYRTNARFFNKRSRRVRPVLFDQFEEAFTLGRTTHEGVKATDLFFDEIADLVRGSMPAQVADRLERDPNAALEFAPGRDPCGVLIALRQEFLADLLRLRSRLPSLLDHRFELSAMTVEEALLVVNGPGGHLVEEEVPERIATFVAVARRGSDDTTTDDTMVDPAILSIFCSELNATRLARQMPRITKDLVAGTQDRIIAEFYTRRVVDQPPDVHRFIEEKLVTESGYRNSAAVEDALREPGVTAPGIDLLIDRRLLRREGHGPRARLELTHDVLLAPIAESRRLRRVHEQEHAERLAVETAKRKADEAEERVRSARELETARVLLDKERLNTQLASQLAEQQSRESHEKGQAIQRQQRLLGVAVVALIGAFALAVVTRNARATAENERLVALSNLASAHIEQGLGLIAGERHDRGLAYVAGALRVDPNHLAARSLSFDALLHHNWALLEGAVRHDESVRFAAFDSTGARLITAAEDNTARVWSTRDWSAVGTPLQHDTPVRLAWFGSEDTAVLTLADDGYVRAWDAASGREIKRYSKGPDPNRQQAADDASQLTAAAFAPGRVATGSSNGTLRIWNGETPIVIAAHPGVELVTASFDRDGTRLVTGAADGSVIVWDAGTGRRRVPLVGHRDRVVDAAFSPDGQQIATASEDATVRVWRLGTQRPSSITLMRGGVTVVRFSPDGGRLLTADKDGAAQLWDASTLAPIGNEMRHLERIVSASFSPEGRRILTASSDATAMIWDAADGAAISEPMHLATPMTDAAFSPDGRRVVTVTSDGTSFVWDVRTGAVVPPTLAAACEPSSTRFTTADGHEVAAICGGVATFWNTAAGEHRQLSNLQPAGLRALEFSSDGNLLAALSAPDPVTPIGLFTVVEIAKAGDGSLVATLPSAAYSLVEFSPDGRALLTLGEPDIRTWDATRGTLRQTLAESGGFQRAHFSHDGSLIVGARTDGTVRLWRAATGATVRTFSQEGSAGSDCDARISRDLTRVLISGDKRRVTVWDVNTGAVVREMPAANRLVYNSWVAPGADAVLTLSDNLQLWDPRTGNLVATLTSGEALAVAFSQDGRRVAVADRDGIKVWDAQTGQPNTEGYLGSHDPNFGREAFRLSADAQRGVSVSREGRFSVVWDVPWGTPADGATIAALLEAIVGYRVNPGGGLEAIDDRITALNRARTECRAATGVAAQVCSWTFGDRSTRALTPFTRTIIGDYIQRQLESGYPADREQAERLFPWDQRLWVAPITSAPAPQPAVIRR